MLLNYQNMYVTELSSIVFLIGQSCMISRKRRKCRSTCLSYHTEQRLGVLVVGLLIDKSATKNFYQLPTDLEIFHLSEIHRQKLNFNQ